VVRLSEHGALAGHLHGELQERLEIDLVPADSYVRESQAEVNKVTWPTRDQTINLTIVVLAVCLVIGIFLGIVDYVFQYMVQQLIVG